MNDPVRQPVETYLRQVEARLGGRPEAERLEILAALRRHIHEALQARGGSPTADDVAAVLMGMDDPADFGEPTPPAGRPATGGSSNRWFLLGLAFLALNGWLAWRLTHPPAGPVAVAVAGGRFEAGRAGQVEGRQPLVWHFDRAIATNPALAAVGTNLSVALRPAVAGRLSWLSPSELAFEPAGDWPACTVYETELRTDLPLPTGQVYRFESAPLRLQEVLQMGLDEDRSVHLRLVFNAAPDIRQLDKFLRLTDARGQALAFTGWESGTVVSNSVLIETASVRAGGEVRIELAAGLPPARGTLGTVAALTHVHKIDEGLTLLALQPESPAFEDPSLSCRFTELIATEDAGTYIEVQPAVKFAVEPYESWRGDGCRLRGAFEPGQVYTLTLKPGLRSVNGQVLAVAVTRQVQFPNRPSRLSIGAEGRYLSPRGSLRVPVSAMNLREVAFSAAPILPQNLVQFVMRESDRYARFYAYSPADWADQLTDRARAVTTSVSGVLNREVKTSLDLRALVQGTPGGAYLITAAVPDGRDDPTHAVVVVTDLGLAARRARNGWLVWVNSLREARPVEEAEVVLYAENGSELGRGRSGVDGTAFLPVVTGEGEAAPILLVARAAGDQSFLALAGTERPQPEGGVREFLAQAHEASVFTDRGIYRPGETLHARAVVRDRQLECPKPFPVVFCIRRPDGEVFRAMTCTLDEFGAAELTSELPAYLPTGRYRVELCLPGTFTALGQTVVALEDFVPPQIRVALTAPAERQMAGGVFTLGVRADHLFGRPAAGLPATGRAALEPMNFASSNWPGFHFGDGERSFSPAGSAQNLGRVELDAEGKGSFVVKLAGDGQPPAALKMVMGVTVTETSGRTVTRYAEVPVDVYPFYIGLRRAEAGLVMAGVSQRVEVVAVTPEGGALAGPRPLKATLYSVQYSTALKRGADERYVYETARTLTAVGEQLVAPNGAAATLAVQPTQAGDYVLVVSDPESGASSSLPFTAVARDQGWANWSRERPDLLPLSADRERYQPGQTARVTIKAPFAGTALLTVESDRIHEQRVLSLTGNTAVVDVPLRAEYAPNVYCQVTLVRPAVAESVWNAHRASGAVLLRVEPGDRRLAMKLEAPEVVRPQGALEFVAQLTEAGGRPAAGEVTVAAVDEAICMLTDFATPDPLADLLAPRWASVLGYDLYSLLMPITEDRAVGVSQAGGDGPGLLRHRLNPIQARRFRPVALWRSGLRADSNGVVRVRLDVPEFTGQLRLMAVAWNRHALGSAEARVLVKRPVVVQTALPRFLAPDDETAGTVQIFNETGAAITGRLRVAVAGPLQVTEPERALRIPAGGTVTERLPLRAGPAAGLGRVSFTVEAGGERYDEDVELAVRPARASEVQAEVGRLAAGSGIELAGPSNWLAGTVSQSVRVSGRPEARLGRALDYLLRYPYGCLEQTVSGALPLLYLPELAEGAVGREEVDRLVRAGILRVLSMQRERGFVLWPRGTAIHEWAGIYATHFLVECRRARHDVPPERLAAALDGLRRRLDESAPAVESPEWLDDMEIRAYACHVLALAGQPEGGWTARLHEQGARLTAGARAHVAAALLLSGQPQAARDRLARTPMPDPATPAGARATLRSGTRDAALLLYAWLEVDPVAPQVAALSDFLLQAQREGHWGTTQDDAWALLALGRYASRSPRTAGGLRGELAEGNRRRAFDENGLVATNVSGRLALTNSGPAEAFYVVQAEGVPANGRAEELDEGLAVRRELLDMAGQPLAVTNLQQGDLVVVKVTVNTGEATVDNLVIEDLLPAGLEIENPNLATAQVLPWIKEKTDWCLHRELRDDRFLLFSGVVSGSRSYYYAARAVSPGRFVWPAISGSAMYRPAQRSVHGGGLLEVKP